MHQKLNNVDVERYVAVFDKQSEVCVAVFDLHRFDADAFRKAFGVEDVHDPMYESYQIDSGKRGFMLQYMPEAAQFNFDRNYYFLEAAVAG